MRDYRLSKQALKELKKLKKADIKIATRIVSAIDNLRLDKITGESLSGHREFKKTRVGKYRIITIIKDETLHVFIIEKRETVYKTFDHFLKSRKMHQD